MGCSAIPRRRRQAVVALDSVAHDVVAVETALVFQVEMVDVILVANRRLTSSSPSTVDDGSTAAASSAQATARNKASTTTYFSILEDLQMVTRSVISVLVLNSFEITSKTRVIFFVQFNFELNYS
jgi:hypothetical protein